MMAGMTEAAMQDTSGEANRIILRPHVLVVDDENGPRQALRMLLKEEYEVRLASGVDAAIRILAQQPIDVVITDIRMPNQSGIDLLRHVRETYPDIGVIILTGYGQLDTAMQAVQYDAFAYMEKPFDNNAMLAKVAACFELRRQRIESRALENLALQANRFETLGRLISGTMHDLGTPLSVLGSHIEMMLDTPERSVTPERLHTMHAQVRHCNDIVRSTMNFLRHSAQEQSLFSLNAVVMTCLEVARPQLTRGNIALYLDADPRLGCIEGEMVLVRQAILNLITNACQAMDEHHGPRVLKIATWSDGTFAYVAIRDTGPGVPPEHRQRIFDALFTTKQERGTGLGLAVVKHVMHRHGGTVSLEAPSSGGARFVLQFPLP